MKRNEVVERFSGGNVIYEVSTHRGIKWIGRIVGILLCVGLIKWMPSEAGSKVLFYMLLLVILWWMHSLDEVLVYICENGFVVKRRPTTVRDYFCSIVNSDDYYVYVPFDTVIGFTEQWKELQAVTSHGGIYVVPLDLQLVSYADKMKLHEALQSYRADAQK